MPDGNGLKHGPWDSPTWHLMLSRIGGERYLTDWTRSGGEGKEMAEAVLECWGGEDRGFLRWKWDKAAATT